MAGRVRIEQRSSDKKEWEQRTEVKSADRAEDARWTFETRGSLEVWKSGGEKGRQEIGKGEQVVLFRRILGSDWLVHAASGGPSPCPIKHHWHPKSRSFYLPHLSTGSQEPQAKMLFDIPVLFKSHCSFECGHYLRRNFPSYHVQDSLQINSAVR